MNTLRPFRLFTAVFIDGGMQYIMDYEHGYRWLITDK